MTEEWGDLVAGHEARSGELWKLLESLPDEDMERAGLEDDWSVKDLVAHLAAWHGRGSADLERMRSGTYRPRPAESPEERLERLERENREYHQAWAGRSWDAVRQEWTDSQRQLLEALQALSEPTEEAAARFRKVAIEHYEEHLPQVREWVQEVGG